jgi:multicomponent Na+:H+ antiporter subunit D
MMEEITSIRPLFAVLVSLLVTPILASSPTPMCARPGPLPRPSAKFILVPPCCPWFWRAKPLSSTRMQILPTVPLAFKVDAFGMLFALVSSSLWIVTSAYSIGYMRGLSEHAQTRYFCFFALALSATIGVAFSANLFTLYLFYEMLSLTTYPLVTHHQDEEARASGRKYLMYIMGTSIGFLLPAMLYIYMQTGTLEFTSGGFISGKVPPGMAWVLMFAFVFGFAKAGVMPFHSWLPAAMVAPTPVSALLHAVAVVKVGVFCILRSLTGVMGIDFLSGLDLGVVLGYVASFTVLAASLRSPFPRMG